jgi:hypothetical protein
MIIALSFVATLLIIANITTILFLIDQRRKLKKQKEIPDSVEKLMGQLLTSGAVVVTEVANPSEIYKWSPRP